MVSTADTTAIITSYNHQAYVEQCLDSIAAQTVRPRQILVFDDASTDDSAAVIEHWIERNDIGAIFHASAVNSGVCAVMNEALRHVTTSSYFHLSADDWSAPERIALQAWRLASANRHIAFVTGDVAEVDAGGLLLAVHDMGKRLDDLTGPSAHGQLHRRLLEGNILLAPGILLRTDAVRQIGGYDEALEFEDYDLWLRLTERFGIEHTPGVVANYRVLSSSLTRSPERATRLLQSEERLLRKHQGEDPESDAVISAHLRRIDATASALTASRTAPEEAAGGRRRPARPARRRSRLRSAD